MQGISAVVGTLSRNLADLQDHQESFISIYDHPALALPDPIIESINTAVNRLTNSTDFLQYLGKHALILEEELPSPSDDNVDERYHFMSLLLNLANTFLYMVNTYIIVPTADSYSLSLGLQQLFVALLLGQWLLLRLGSARAINRRYITDCVPLNMRMKASAGFVSASALGMACGPALASLLQTKFKIFKVTFNEDTLPGWVMALAWLVYLFWLWMSFEEPSQDEKVNSVQQETNSGLGTGGLQNGVSQPLLSSSIEKQQNEDEDEDEDEDISEEASEESCKPVTSIMSAYKLLTPSVKVSSLIAGKYAMEVLLAESSVITAYYFIWSSSNVAIFLACLGLTVLPVNVIVGSYLTNMFEERQVLLASEVMVFVGIVLSFHIIIPYSVPQYVCSALLTFVAAEVLEGVNLSLLSRVMSSRLSRGTYNGGLLSTEAGTLARVVADGTITVAGYWGMSKLLNATLLPSLLICICSIVATCFTYNSLY
ncbi:UNVERIFIED_CONTAM: SPX domain-containing membrane protein [Sesamum radiatum]|uniref:SPX domain-containing membrane protein n=1 Tax=Sesamum radiatum TaxID=300843 RepID=A0AAW2VHJ7_SESRA